MQVLVPAHIIKEVTAQLQGIRRNTKTIPLDGLQPAATNHAEVLLRFFPNSVYPGRVFDAAMLCRTVLMSPQLKWIHNGMTGMDGVLYPQLVESDIIVTNGSGAHRQAIAESALGMMLAWSKRFYDHIDNQRNQEWQHLPHSVLRGKTALVIGLGSVGYAIAELCAAFGMRIIGIKRQLTEITDSTIEIICSPAALHKLLPEADYVIIAAVLTNETRGMIGEAELRLMKPTAYLVNIARGEITDEQMLIKALSERWIAGAALDVFTTEPLPHSSPLWTHPHVFITPHNAAWSGKVEEEALGIFYENFRRYVNGRPLLNVVDKTAGY